MISLVGVAGFELAPLAPHVLCPTGMAFTPMLVHRGPCPWCPLVGLGVIDWLAHDADAKGLAAVLSGNLVVQVLSLGVVLRTMAIGAGAAVAPGVAIHLLMGGLFAIFLMRLRRRKANPPE